MGVNLGVVLPGRICYTPTTLELANSFMKLVGERKENEDDRPIKLHGEDYIPSRIKALTINMSYSIDLAEEVIEMNKNQFIQEKAIEKRWYKCNKCDFEEIIQDFSRCPHCGVKLNWDEINKV